MHHVNGPYRHRRYIPHGETHEYSPHGPHRFNPHGPHGHSPHGPHRHSPHGPHGHSPHGGHGPHGHSPHGGHGYSPHGGYGPHGHSPHGGHGPHGHHDHEKHVGNKKEKNNPQVFPQPEKQNIPDHESFPKIQSISQTKPLINQDTDYTSHQGEFQQPNYSSQKNYLSPQDYHPSQQDLKIVQSNHEHSLNYMNLINAQCKICKQEIGGQPGYTCGNCKLILCLNCAQKIFYGKKNNFIHSHPLLLKDRNSWKCNLCNQFYKNVASFYCKQCDFDACSACYIP